MRVVDGQIRKDSSIKMMATGAEGIALEAGSLNPDMAPALRISTGEIGYIVTNLKTTREARVGDTVTLVDSPAKVRYPAIRKSHPSSTPASSPNRTRITSC